jgi:TolB-like protein/tetratricopeptide (TPR) repeat protein
LRTPFRERVKSFAAELRRRRVPQTALWYAGSAVAVVEAANNFLPSLGAPAGATRLLVILAVFGFPIAITLSWFYDVSSTTARESWKRTAAVLVVGGISLFGAFVVWNKKPQPATSDAASFTADQSHLAVLGFENIGDDPDLAAFAANLQTRLIDGLSAASSTGSTEAKRLRVVSRASILPFSKPDVSIDSIRRALKVGTVLNGSVERTSDGVRVNVRVVDAESGDQIAAFDTTATDKVAMLDALSAPVLDMIRKRVGDVMRNRMRLLETKSPDAYEQFAAGMLQADRFPSAYRQHDLTGASSAIERADSLFAAAEKYDKRWLDPILERGRLSIKRAMLARAMNSDPAKLADAYKIGIAHADRALKLMPNNYQALALRGVLRAEMSEVAPPKDPAAAQKLFDDAENDLEASLVSNPTPARSLRALSELAGRRGRLDEALEYGKRAYREDPYLEQAGYTVFRVFEYSFELGNDSEAMKWCREGRERFNDPIFEDCRLSLAAWSDAFSVKPDSGWLLVQSELAEYPAPLRSIIEPRLQIMAAAVLARAHMNDSARAVIQRARQHPANSGDLRAAAGAFELLSMSDSANQALKDLQKDPSVSISELNNAPELRKLRARHAF